MTGNKRGLTTHSAASESAGQLPINEVLARDAPFAADSEVACIGPSTQHRERLATQRHSTSRDRALDQLSVHIGEAMVASARAEGEAAVVDAK